MSKKQKIGLCIGGGGTKGVASLPIIEALLSRGVKFDLISGTSVGAVMTSYLAAHGEVTSFKEKLLGMSTKDWIALTDPVLPPRKSLIKGKKFEQFYKSLFPKENMKFSDLSTPLIVTASNIRTGRAKYFEKGSLVDALMASSAYPGIFPPYKIDDDLYADGGIFDNLPYEILLDRGMDKVIVINLNSLNSDSNKFENIAGIIARTFELMRANVLKHLPLNNKKLFVYSLSFPSGPDSVFGVKNLVERCAQGEKVYNEKEQELSAWLNK